MSTNRRNFLKTTAAAGAAMSTPLIWNRTVKGQDANSKKTVASIGVGGSRGRYNRGGSIANSASKLGQMIAVCDVDELHTGEFNKKHGGNLKQFTDYRKLFDEVKPDIVTIGTPDHWHVPIALRALEAGADVYCEKPLTLTIQEGIEVQKAVEANKAVFQVGTQQRSENGGKFLKAIAMVRSGRLGDNVRAQVAIGGAPGDGPFKPTAVPKGLDWDMWVGPAAKADYSEQRRRMFRWWFEYSGGKMTDWGAHHIDIAQWALGHEASGPVSVKGAGKFGSVVPDDFNWVKYFNGDASLPSGYNTAVSFAIDLEFGDGKSMHVTNHYKQDGTDFGNGILFQGSKGRIFVNRGKLTGKPVEELSAEDNKELDSIISELYKGKQPGNHMKNFFECVDDRTQPVSDVASHHRTMTSCHLCNIVLMLGRELKWDPKKEEFLSDEQANALRTRKQRDGFV